MLNDMKTLLFFNDFRGVRIRTVSAFFIDFVGLLAILWVLFDENLLFFIKFRGYQRIRVVLFQLLLTINLSFIRWNIWIIWYIWHIRNIWNYVPTFFIDFVGFLAILWVLFDGNLLFFILSQGRHIHTTKVKCSQSIETDKFTKLRCWKKIHRRCFKGSNVTWRSQVGYRWTQLNKTILMI
jgi:hypothetical protein